MATAAYRVRHKNMASQSFDLLDRYFYLAMTFVIAVILVYGFSHTIGENLIHPAEPRPLILYVHATVFTGWIALLMTQSALIRTHHVKLHRKLGLCGVALGTAIPIVGVATSIVMARFNIRHGSTDSAQFLIVPLFDMLVFTIVFALAIVMRSKPEYHRRLMLVAACALTVAAFGRFPATVVPDNWAYAGVDVLILFAVLRDAIVTKRIHAVYLYGLPALIIGQVATEHIFLSAAPQWVAIARWLIG